VAVLTLFRVVVRLPVLLEWRRHERGLGVTYGAASGMRFTSSPLSAAAGRPPPPFPNAVPSAIDIVTAIPSDVFRRAFDTAFTPH